MFKTPKKWKLFAPESFDLNGETKTSKTRKKTCCFFRTSMSLSNLNLELFTQNTWQNSEPTKFLPHMVMFLMVNSHRKKNISNQSKEVQEEIPQCCPFQNKLQKGSSLFQKYKSPQQTNPNSKKQILPKQPEIPWFSWFIYPWHRWFLLNHKPPANSFQIPMDASFKIHGAINFLLPFLSDKKEILRVGFGIPTKS